MSRSIDAEEAAARLGVKKETLYAYVSRGLIERRAHPDGKRSLFDVDAVDALRARSRRSARGELGTIITSAITHVRDAGLEYRGRALRLCVRDGLEPTLGRLWQTDAVTIPNVRGVPELGAGLDRLRVAVIHARTHDALRWDADVSAGGAQMIGAMLAALGGRGRDPIERLWRALGPQPCGAAKKRALETAWIALLDHGLATSTFAVRVAASTRADLYSCVSAGLGALAGPLHGAASADVHRMFARAHETDVATALSETRVIEGTGHSVYRQQDPREAIVSKALRVAWRDDARWKTVERVRKLAGERGRLLNVDFALGALTWLAEMDSSAGELIFAIARTAGWCAHFAEERTEAPLRFRPQARYAP